ncbi:hypothetical protein ACU6W1_07875 [Weissella cibaria]
MGLAIQVGASAVAMVLFIGLAYVAKTFMWPLWLSIIVFILAFVAVTVLMTLLTMALRPKKEDDD